MVKWASGVKLYGSNPEPLMSALGQKRTSECFQSMSALPPIADIGTQPLMSALCQKRTSIIFQNVACRVKGGPHVPLTGPREDDGKCAPYPSYLPRARRFQREDGGCRRHSFQIRPPPLAKVQPKAEADCANRLHTNPRAGGKRCTTKPESFP